MCWALLEPQEKTAHAHRFTCQTKTIPPDPKLLKEAKWIDQASGPAGIMVINAKPGIVQQRWVVETEAGPVNMHYPGETVPDLCKKIHAEHVKDEKKFPGLMLKAAAKKEGHAYNTNEGKAKTDCDELGKLVNPEQMSADMEPLKAGLVNLENLMPGNDASVSISISKGYGTYKTGAEDEAPELSLTEKGMMMKDQKLNDPPTFTKVLDAKEKATRQASAVMVGTICRAMGTTQKDLLPDLDAQLDQANGRKPEYQTEYNKLEKYTAHVGAGEKPTPEEVEAKRKEEVKAIAEADKLVHDEKVAEDKDYAALKKATIDRLQAQIDYCREATKPAEEGQLNKGVRVVAKWKDKYMMLEGTLDTGVLTDANRDGKKYCIVKFDDTDSDSVDIENICLEKPEPAPQESLFRGARVRAKFYGDVFMDGKITGAPNKDGNYPVRFDVIYEQADVKPADIRLPFDLGEINKHGVLVPKTFYDIGFQWVQAEEDLDVTLRLWREGMPSDVVVCFLFRFELHTRRRTCLATLNTRTHTYTHTNTGAQAEQIPETHEEQRRHRRRQVPRRLQVSRARLEGAFLLLQLQGT